MSIGILALQGAFAKHIEMLASLDQQCAEVRRPEALDLCSALVIPGGESTTMTHLLNWGAWLPRLQAFVQESPVLGTCAGAILLASEVVDASVPCLACIDISIERNAYGRQLQSCYADVDWADGRSRPGFFIRAPKITRVGPNVEVLATWQGEPVLVRQGIYMAATYHPELTADSTVHQLFLSSSTAGK